MKLCQSKPVRVFYHHDGCIGHIYTNLHYSCGHQHLRLVICKALHHLILRLALHPAVKHIYLDILWQRRFKHICIICDIFPFRVFGFLHKRTYNIRLMAGSHLLSNEAVGLWPECRANHTVLDGKPLCRHLIYDRDIHITVYDYSKRTRYRSGTHHKYMWLLSLIGKALSLLHTKSVLLICDNKRQIGKIRFLLYERMSAYNKRIFLIFKACIRFSFLLCRHRACQKHNRTVKPKLTDK